MNYASPVAWNLPKGNVVPTSRTVVLRRMTPEQLASYHETGIRPALEDVPLVGTVPYEWPELLPMDASGSRRVPAEAFSAES